MKTRLIGFFGLGISILGLSIVLSSCSKSSDPNAQLNKELNDINVYVAANSSKYSDVSAGSSIVIGLINSGDGPIPIQSTGQKVSVKYTARLLSGTVYKTDSLQSQELDDLDLLIPGLSWIAYLQEGTHAEIFVPSPGAYGKDGNSTLGVPPNTTIVYEVTLTKVIPTAAQAAQLSIDQQRIQHYMDSLQINAYKLPSGVWVQTISPGTGDHPKPFDYVTFHYKGIVLSSGTVFQESDVTTSPLISLIAGLRQGIPYMAEGGSTYFYIPSLYAYGTNKDSSGNIVNPGIPSNASLIFQIQLNGVNQ